MRFRLVRSAVLGVAVVLVNVSPAGAGVGDTAANPHATTEVQSRAVSHDRAGYEYTPEEWLGTASVRSLRVPTIDCSSPEYKGAALGIGGGRGIPASALLSMKCDEQGNTFYTLGAFVCQMGDGFTDIQPGERVRMSFAQPSDHDDATATVTVLSRSDRPTISVTFGIETCHPGLTRSMFNGALPFQDGHGLLPFPDFADTRLHGVKVNGSCLNEDAKRKRLDTDYGTMKASRLRNCGFTVRAYPTAPDTLTQPGDSRLAPTAPSGELADPHVYDWAGSASNARSIVH